MPLVFSSVGSAKAQKRPFAGTWKVVKLGTTTPQRTALWTFNSDGTCTISNQQGRWIENKGLLKIVKSRTGEYRFNWRVNNGGKQLVLTAAPGFAGGQLPPFTFDKVE